MENCEYYKIIGLDVNDFESKIDYEINISSIYNIPENVIDTIHKQKDILWIAIPCSSLFHFENNL